MLDYIYLSFIGASVVFGLIFMQGSSHIAYKLLLILLVVTLVNEVMCYFIKKHGPTNVFYNIYWYFRFILLGLIFQTIFTTKNRFVTYFIRSFYVVSVVLFFVCYSLYGGIFKQVHTIYLLTGGVFVIICSLLLFYQSVNDDDTMNPFAFPFFLSSVGLFLYFLCILPFFGIINLLVKNYYSIAGHPTLIAKSISIVFYSLISVDYYLQWKRTKYPS